VPSACLLIEYLDTSLKTLATVERLPPYPCAGRHPSDVAILMKTHRRFALMPISPIASCAVPPWNYNKPTWRMQHLNAIIAVSPLDEGKSATDPQQPLAF